MQLEFFDVPSPCIGICQSDDKGQCLGCFRTREERLNWTSSDSDQRQKPVKIKVAEVIVENKQASLLDTPSKPRIDNSNDFDFNDFEL